MAANDSRAGLEAVFLENRERLRRFLVARGAGDAADDLLQEVWLKIAQRESGRLAGPIAAPLSYLFRTADLLMIDRYRSVRQAERRERAWTDTHDGTTPGVSDAPSVERHLIGREHARLVAETLDALGARPAAIFRRHRVDGIAQRLLAQEFGVSLSTIESDLRRAYAALAQLKERLDEA
ncbi:MAG: RNA polymerase subunit sigma-70 [Sphingomonadales bacterium 32-68-7]|nr:MAG: RNA polymerase subunit sigma-70 [Sphingomonadales bacterium 12-68-11]OYX09571.1 MAG: RNA polymerase subunit sigma-70 [Sphingomonadales bacterium 32-68-7]